MKTALVTGGGGGIGTAISLRLAAAGYRVGVLDVAGGRAAAVAALIAGAQALEADVADEGSMRAALDAFGAVPDLLVNNAGIVRLGPFLAQNVADLRAVVEVNLMGTIVPTLLVARGMVERGSGIIVNMASIAGIAGGVGTGAYGATKAGVAALTQHLAVELGPSGVRVNAVAPGMIDAGMGSRANYASEAAHEARRRAIPSRRFGLAEDIANAVLFLASDEASYVNGHVLVVDGAVTPSLLAQMPR